MGRWLPYDRRLYPPGVMSMHEMSLCAGIVSLLEEQARVHDYTRVKTVWLEVGELAAVEVEALRFGFDVVTRDTVAEGAELEIIDVPGAARCVPCGATVATHRRFDACPRCGSYQLQITAGEELRVKELEVE